MSLLVLLAWLTTTASGEEEENIDSDVIGASLAMIYLQEDGPAFWQLSDRDGSDFYQKVATIAWQSGWNIRREVLDAVQAVHPRQAHEQASRGTRAAIRDRGALPLGPGL